MPVDEGQLRSAAWPNLDAVTASYRQTTLNAFQGVADNLASMRTWNRRRSRTKPRLPLRIGLMSLQTDTKVALTTTFK